MTILVGDGVKALKETSRCLALKVILKYENSSIYIKVLPDTMNDRYELLWHVELTEVKAIADAFLNEDTENWANVSLIFHFD